MSKKKPNRVIVITKGNAVYLDLRLYDWYRQGWNIIVKPNPKKEG